MLPNVLITSLPAAGTITGTEVIPMVQNGRTVKVTSADLAGVTLLTQTVLTLNTESSIPQSRRLQFQDPIFAVDNGPQGSLAVRLSDALTSVSNLSASGFVTTDGAGNFSSAAVTPGAVPAGGAANYTLTKLSATTEDMDWVTPYNVFNIQNMFFPEQFGALGDAVGAHDGVLDAGTGYFTSATYAFQASDLGKPFFEDGNQRTITEVTNGAIKTTPAMYGSTGILWLMTTDDTVAIRAAQDAARAVQGPEIAENTGATDQMIPSGGGVYLQPGKRYGVSVSSAQYSGGQLAAVTIYRRCYFGGLSPNAANLTGLVVMPGSYGHAVSNISASSYTDFVNCANFTVFGYKDFQTNALDGVHLEVPTDGFEKTDAYNRFDNITVIKAKRDGFYFAGRGELVVNRCDSFNAGRYNFNATVQYDWKMTSCNFGAAEKAGVYVYGSGAANISNMKSFYSGSAGGSVDEDCANLVLDGDVNTASRQGFVYFNNCQFQESRGCSIVVKTGNNQFGACQFFDPVRSVLGGGTLPTIKAGVYLKGQGARMNTFGACMVGPSVQVFTDPNWSVDTYGVYIDPLVSSSGPQANRGDIYSYVATVNTGGATQVGTQYSGTGAVKGGGGVTNGQNTGLRIDGVACT